MTSFSCENRGFLQTRNDSKKAASPTPAQPNEKPQLNAEEHFSAALKFEAAGQIADASEEFKRAIEAGKNDKEMYRRVAELLIKQKKFEEAANYLRKIIEKDARDARAHWALAKVLVEDLEKYQEGLKEAMLAKELYGNDGTSYVQDLVLARAYDGLGNYAQAVKHYRIFLAGSSTPDSDSYQRTRRRLSELELLNQKLK